MTPAPKPGVLRVGDRVSVNGWLAGGSYCNGHPGVVEREVRLPDRLEVRMDFDGGIYQVHPKQCRKLRPAKRREWHGRWVQRFDGEGRGEMQFRPDSQEHTPGIGIEMTLRKVKP